MNKIEVQSIPEQYTTTLQVFQNFRIFFFPNLLNHRKKIYLLTFFPITRITKHKIPKSSSSFIRNF